MLEKDPARRITAADALRHEYFTAGRSLKKAPSTDDLYAMENTNKKDAEDLPNIREK